MIEERKLANEGEAAFYSAESMQWLDRCQFVDNLGWLLRQTWEGIAGMKLIRKNGGEIAIIWYNDGARKEVNVTHDSYTAIIKDVVRNM